MNQYLQKVCFGTGLKGDGGLYEIGCNRYQEDCKEIKLVLQVMIQASMDVYQADVDEYIKRDAYRYFYSDHFLYHCMLAGLDDDDNVRKLFLSRPGKGAYHAVHADKC